MSVGVLVTHIGRDVLPKTDAGQFQVRLRAPEGTRMEETEKKLLASLHLVEELVGKENVTMSSAYVGLHPALFAVSPIYLFMPGPHEAVLQVQLDKARPQDRRLQGGFSRANAGGAARRLGLVRAHRPHGEDPEPRFADADRGSHRGPRQAGERGLRAEGHGRARRARLPPRSAARPVDALPHDRHRRGSPARGPARRRSVGRGPVARRLHVVVPLHRQEHVDRWEKGPQLQRAGRGAGEQDGEPRQRRRDPVEVGRENHGKVEIFGDVRRGDRPVARASEELRDGTAIEGTAPATP